MNMCNYEDAPIKSFGEHGEAATKVRYARYCGALWWDFLVVLRLLNRGPAVAQRIPKRSTMLGGKDDFCVP